MISERFLIRCTSFEFMAQSCVT